MKLTVVVPTYNLGSYIKALLDDLTAQTVDFELWLIDDGSTDETATRLTEFVRGISDFHAVQLAHRGVSVARNYGLQHATGDGVVFIDGDDLVAPTFVASLSQGLAQGVVLAAVGYEWFRRPRSRGNNFIELDQREMFAQVSQHGTEIGGYIWNKAFSRAALLTARLTFDESLYIAEDYLFTASFVAQTPGKYVYLPQVLYTKRNRPDSTIHTATWHDRQTEDTVFKRIRALQRLIQ